MLKKRDEGKQNYMVLFYKKNNYLSNGLEINYGTH